MLKGEKTLDGFTRLFICCLNPWLSRQRGSVKATEYSMFLQDLKKRGSRFEFVGKKEKKPMKTECGRGQKTRENI